jgi:hypothetical protein
MFVRTDNPLDSPAQYVVRLVESVTNPGEYIWIYQTIEGARQEEYDKRKHDS